MKTILCVALYFSILSLAMIISGKIDIFIDYPGLFLTFIPWFLSFLICYPYQQFLTLIRLTFQKVESDNVKKTLTCFLMIGAKLALFWGSILSFIFTISAAGQLSGEDSFVVASALTLCLLPLFYGVVLAGLMYVLSLRNRVLSVETLVDS
ncbi:hypothetical protein [Veronia pacifica]|uniref:DUF2975 domain-containing protein n=1 Tax=Veronia pacifica TaxID=1080227 RepID=A0A1C3EAG7_9GAMM|nr:hypothetical protein [Veronia pacifica]ODA30223.1 hypothetical protein A8L45_20690 [Veronia pacifica]